MNGTDKPRFGSRGRAPAWVLALATGLGVAALVPAQASAAVTFTPPTNHPAGDAPFGIVTADFNGDSDPDLAVADRQADAISVLLGGAGASFAPATSFAVGDAPLGLAVGDFNADSDPDLVVANSVGTTVSVLLGGAGGSFGAATPFTVGTNPFDAAVGDFNADSDPDLAVANQISDNVSILLGGAGGGFGAATNITTGDGARSVAVADFNDDADPDLAVGNQGSGTSASVSILLGGAGGSFGAPTNLPSGFVGFNFDVEVGDFNGDADPDLATTLFGTTDHVSVRLGGAGSSFGGQTTFATGDNPFDLDIADFNGDADPDLAVANSSSNDVSVLLGGAGGGFGAATNFAVGAGSSTTGVTAADFDGDSDFDLAVTAQGTDVVAIFLNTSKPAVALDPASLGFGSQTLNTTSAPRGVAVTNTGDAPLRISDVRVVGANQLDFDIVSDDCEGATVLVGDGCVVRATFSPSAAGARSASLRITDNAPGSPHSVPLTGTGAVPNCGGLTATIVGTPGSDTLVGTGGADVVTLLGGDDSFAGAAGVDRVCAGSGSDEVRGDQHRDLIWGQEGDDDLRGVDANDTLRGGSDDDELSGGGGPADVCHGGSGIDSAGADCETVSNVP